MGPETRPRINITSRLTRGAPRVRAGSFAERTDRGRHQESQDLEAKECQALQCRPWTVALPRGRAPELCAHAATASSNNLAEREAIVLPRCRPTRPTGLDTSPLALQSPSTPWSSKGKLSPPPSLPSQAGRWSAREQHHRQAEHVGGENQTVRACELLRPLLEGRTRPRCDQVNWSQIRQGHGRATLQDDLSSPLAA